MSNDVISDLKDRILNLSLLEASNLVKELEEQLGISAMAMPQAQASAVAEVAEEEKSEYKLVIKNISLDKKMEAIKLVRSLLSLGLKESKEFVESTEAGRSFGDKDYSKEQAEDLKKKLAAVGIVVDLE